MNKLVKKSAGLVLSLVMAGSLLAGCNSQSAQGNQTDKKPETAAAKPVEIEFWYGLGGKLGDTVKQYIEDFNNSQKEVKVIGVAQGNYTETFQKLQASIASGQAPAAVLLNNDSLNSLASKNVLAPLDTYIAKDKEFKPEDYIKAFYQQGTINGKQYALPLYGTTQVMYYRKDIFEKAGVSPDALNTWESLSEAAAKLTQKNGSEVQVYAWEPMWGKGNLIDAALSRGGKYLSEDGKTVLIDSPEWVETWEFFRKAIHVDKTMRIHHGGQGWEYWYKTIDDVMQGRSAGYTGSSGDQGDLDFSKIAAHPQPGWKGSAAKPHAEALMAGVPASVSPDKQEAAFKWMKYFTSSQKTAEWSMKTGYIAVRKSARDVQEFKNFAEKNPQVLVPLKQAETATSSFVDPTGGKISDALKKAADRVEIEGVPAADALRQAKEEAQKALDKVK
jgi:multiple sugar transport system substrate-binding protein